MAYDKPVPAYARWQLLHLSSRKRKARSFLSRQLGKDHGSQLKKARLARSAGGVRGWPSDRVSSKCSLRCVLPAFQLRSGLRSGDPGSANTAHALGGCQHGQSTSSRASARASASTSAGTSASPIASSNRGAAMGPGITMIAGYVIVHRSRRRRSTSSSSCCSSSSSRRSSSSSSSSNQPQQRQHNT